MKRFLLAATVLSLAAAPAYAWDNTQSGPGPKAIGDSGGAAAASTAHARAHATGGAGGAGGSVVNNISLPSGYGSPAQAAYGVDPAGASGSNTYTNTTNTSIDVPRLVPSPYAPTIISGPCTGNGKSGSVTTGFFGLAFGGNDVDRVCQLHSIGQDRAAKEYLCRQDDDIRAAFKAAGQPCAADIKHVNITQARNNWPDWCFTASPGERLQHKECDQRLTITTSR